MEQKLTSNIAFTAPGGCKNSSPVSYILYILDIVALSGYLLSLCKLGLCRPHVWGRFCLSYNDQKLLVDTDYVRDYGVKDGDQLHFVRHVSISYNMVKKRSKKVFVDSKHKHMSQSPSINCSDEEQNDRKIYKCNDKGKGKLHHIADQGCFRGHHEIRVTRLLGEWFSHCKIASLGKKRVEDLACPSRVTTGFWGGFKKIIQRCGIGGKCYSRRATILLSNGRRHP